MKILKRIVMPKNRHLRRWRNVLVVILLFVLVFTGFNIYRDSFSIYDFSHLTVFMNFGEMTEFVPLPGESVPDMVRAAENEFLALYVNPYTTAIAVYDKRNSHIWHSSPPGGQQDPRANPGERNIMRSIAGINFYDLRRNNLRWTYNDSVAHEQHEIFSLPNGLAMRFVIGDKDLGIYALPRYIEVERFQTRVLDQIENEADRGWIHRNWHETDLMPGFRRMSSGVRVGVQAQRQLAIFEAIGYTLDELEYDNSVSGYQSERTLSLITFYLEFVLDGDTMVVNVPLHRIELSDEVDRFSGVEIMRFFGAANQHEEGFILIPSGSGAIMNFNNHRFTEERFVSPMYGFDFLRNPERPQVLQSVRLPVFGINKGNAAIVAHVENGAALATISADVAGRTNSFNYAWFTFTTRTSQRVEIGLPGNHRVNSKTIIQEQAYYGDLTVRYHFLAGEEVTLGDMADAYRGFLISRGALTPITEIADRTFYLDIVGAVDVVAHILGIPYMTHQVMTSFDEAHHILNILNSEGVHNIQMQLHGWFNGGINHDVATNVQRIRGLGSVNEMQQLDARLQNHGGALNPTVNFMVTNFFSRNFNTNFEVARDNAGWLGIMSRVSREMLTARFGHHRNDWFYLVHPGVIPNHVDDFIGAYSRRIGLDGLALADMGDMLTESLYRRNAIDREHARLVNMEQMARLSSEFPNMVVFGGNDYSFRYASHLVDVPVRTDWFYIICHEVPFYQMVLHGFIEFAGSSINMRPSPDLTAAFLNSMATGASPRFTMTAQPTRLFQFSPHERMYSTQYVNWIDAAISHYVAFNEVYRNLLTERIVDFVVLGGTVRDSVTVTIFSNGTRIYVNNSNMPFEAEGVFIPAFDFVVVA